jgi:N-methylhydantoinase A
VPTPRATRRVLFEGAGWLDCPVYDRYALRSGARLQGPALIEERESTCVVGPDSGIAVDAFLNLVIELP